MLEPLFVKNDVSVVFAGHDHFYERIKPQQGIVYFVTGSGGKLRKGDIDREKRSHSRGFDTDLAFLAAEINGDELYFNAISRTGAVIDSGVIERRKQELGASSAALSSPAARPPLSLPVRFEDRLNLFRNPRVGDDDADLAAAVQLQLAQALAADEGRRCRRERWRARAGAGLCSLRVSMPAIALSSLPMILISTPALCRSASSAQDHALSDILTS